MSDQAFSDSLKKQAEAGLLRTDGVCEKQQSARTINVKGNECIDFSSNSYLGLQYRAAGKAAAHMAESGASSTCSSRMVSGTTPLHITVESQISELFDMQASALFGSGYLACMGTVAALATSRDAVFYDEQIHSSLRRGIELSRSTSKSFSHLDMNDLENKLRQNKTAGKTFVITDGLFSMQGDYAPVGRISELVTAYGAILIIDEAHSAGATGMSGKGTFERAGKDYPPGTVIVGTLSKTFASFGGYACSGADTIRYVKARSKEFIYTTAASEFHLLCAQFTLNLLASPEGARLRSSLLSNISRLSKALDRSLESYIVPIQVSGGPTAVVNASAQLTERGIFAIGMRYPTVPRGNEMIRVSLSSEHTQDDIDTLSEAVADLKISI